MQATIDTIFVKFLNEKISEYIWIVHSYHEKQGICNSFWKKDCGDNQSTPPLPTP